MKKSNIQFLEELKKKLLIFAGLFISILVLAGLFSKKLLFFILSPDVIGKVNLVTLSPYENASILIYLILLVTFIFSLPLLIYQILIFIKSALTKREKIIIFFILMGSLPLAITGILFGFFLSKIIILPFLSNLIIDAGVSNSWSVIQFVKFFVTICFGMGLAFQMPLVIFFLVKTNILQVETISKMRKYVFISLIIFAALITPPDVFSLIIVTVPLFLLFEISLLVSRLVKIPPKKLLQIIALWKKMKYKFHYVKAKIFKKV